MVRRIRSRANYDHACDCITMKIYINKYRDHWFSPYTMIDYLFFWTDRHKSDRPKWAEAWCERLVPLSRAIQKLLDWIHPKIDYVKIDHWDTWSMDHTLASVTLPMLRQLKDTKHGSPCVDDADVPEELKSTSAPPKKNEWDTDENHHKRWDWVLAEMIFAFECKLDHSWQDEFRSGELEYIHVPVDQDGNEVSKKDAKFYQMRHGPNHTYKCDYEGMQVVEKRIQFGFLLFGKYYQNLWD